MRDTVAAGNSAGFRLISNVAGAASELNIENCVAAGNGIGIGSEGGRDAVAIVRVSNTTVTNNDRGLFSAGAVLGSLLTRGNNTVEGNTTDGSFTGAFAAK